MRKNYAKVGHLYEISVCVSVWTAWLCCQLLWFVGALLSEGWP